MAYELKTKEHDASVLDFINSIVEEKKRNDALALLKIFEEASSFPAKMWGPAIIGFGTFTYTYASGHSGSFMQMGFSPRKNNFSLYFSNHIDQETELIKLLGKVKTGKSCIYFNKLEELDPKILLILIEKALTHFKNQANEQA